MSPADNGGAYLREGTVPHLHIEKQGVRILYGVFKVFVV